MARRFVEAGARFIEVSHGSWDHHNNMKADMESRTSEIDQPIAGLLYDLKKRGLLESTLVIWAGEFGRTPEAPTKDGRKTITIKVTHRGLPVEALRAG